MKEVVKTVSVVTGSNVGLAALSWTEALRPAMELTLMGGQILVAFVTVAYVVVKIRAALKKKD